MNQKKTFREEKISRRDFVKTSAAAGVGSILVSNSFAGMIINEQKKKRYVIVGVGGRSRMYQDAIQKNYNQYCELVGFCDVNLGRLQLAQERSKTNNSIAPPIYDAKDFDQMIQDTKPNIVIVTTVDGFHHKYIVRAMELGCDVITEKPMTIDAEKCQLIINTQKKTGKKCTVTFNYRYSPPRSQVKDILMSGEIGDLLSMDFHWMLNTFHGADYFRRWHSQKKFSGGLMVHKATHHFDLVNWWLSAIPVSVFANGKRDFYTPKMVKRFGLESHHERCHTCPEKDKCGFELDLAKDKNLKALYLDNEKYDGYFRDRCVFRPDIDIEDTMNVVVKYDNDVTMSYSLNAFNAWEGYHIVFNGTKGRVEHEIQEKFIRASGPGGQNINKVATAVQIRFNVENSPSLPDDVRKRLIRMAGKRITDDGLLIIHAQQFRSQNQNRQAAIGRLVHLIRKAAETPRTRRKTAPTRASKRRRLKAKRYRSRIKHFRQPVSHTEE